MGLRTRTYYVLSGSVLSVWNKVERVLVMMPGGSQTKMQVIRLRTDDNQRIVGKLSFRFEEKIIRPPDYVLGNYFSYFSSKTYVSMRRFF